MFYYTVRPGDTLYGLASFYGVTVAAILAVNPGLNPYNLYAGQVILIPVPGYRPPYRPYPPYPIYPRPPFYPGGPPSGAPGGGATGVRLPRKPHKPRRQMPPPLALLS